MKSLNLLVLAFVVIMMSVSHGQGQLKVIGAGQGRTGTKSLKEALKMLGYKTYHMEEVLMNGHTGLVADALAAPPGKEREAAMDRYIDAIVEAGYNATLDWPAALVFDYQLKRFPNAKVIYTYREPEAWFKSFDALIQSFCPRFGWPITFFADTVKFQDAMHNYANCKFKRFYWAPPMFPWINYTYRVEFDHDACIESFLKHERFVKETVPKENLLFYHVKDGWEPLCKFLGVPLPKAEHTPNINSKEQIQTFGIVLRVIAIGYPFIVLFLLFLLYATCSCITKALFKTKSAKQKQQ